MTAANETDCHAIAMRLYEYLDREMTREDEAAVRAHLADCRGCVSLFNFEGAYLKFLSARANARNAPDHLRKRIFEQLLCNEDESASA